MRGRRVGCESVVAGAAGSEPLTAMREVDLALEALAAQQSAAVTGQWAVVTGECALAVPPDTMADSLSISYPRSSPDHTPSATMH